MSSNPAFASLLRIRIAVLLALAAGAVLVPHARAQTITDWTGGTSTSWTLAGNWNGGVPANSLTGNITRFNQTSYSFAPTASNSRQIAGIIIGNGTTQTPTFTITTGTGTSRLQIGASGIVMNANSGATTIGAATTQGLLVAADQSWTNNSSSLLTISDVSNAVTTSNYTVTINGAGTGGTTISRIISDNGAGKIALVINTTNGTTTLSGANTFTGGLTLNTGTLSLGNNAALGGAANIFTINGGTIDVTAARTTTNNNAQNWNGDFTFNGTNTLDLGTGAVAMNANRIVTVNASTLTVGGIISGAGFGLTKAGAGNLTLTGANTFTGNLTINSGTVNGTVSGAFGAGAILLGDTTASNSNSATLRSSFLGTHTNNITVNSGSSGTLSITGVTNNTTFSGTVALNNNLTLDHATASRNITLSGAITQDSSARTITKGTGSGTVEISGATTLGSGGLTLANSGSAVFTHSGGITGTGDLTLRNNSTGASGITISTASVNNTGTITNSGSGTGSVTISGGVGSNVSRITQNSSTSNLTVGAIAMNSAGTTLVNNQSGSTATLSVTGGITGTGDLTLNNNSSTASGITISTASVNNTGTITNSGSGTGSVTISGGVGSNVTNITQNSATSALTLNGTSSNTGNININAGTLQFATTASLYNATTANWTASKIKVSSGGTLMLSVNGTGQFGTSDVTTLLTNLGGANGSSTGGFAAGSIIGFDTSSSSFTISDNIADTTGSGGGSLGLTKAGANTLTLSGNLGFSGGVTGNAGSLILSGPLNFGGGITVNGGTLRIGNGSSSNAANYTGPTTINGGTLTVSLNGTVFDKDVTNNGNLNIADGTAQTLTGNISGTGNLTYSGVVAKSNVISGVNNSYTGQTSITSSVQISKLADLGVNSSLGAPTTVANGTINLNQTASSNARLLYVGSGDTSNRVINFLNNTGGFTSEIQSSGSGALVLTSDLTTSGAAKTLTLSGSNTGNNMIQGIIPDASGGNATTLVKSGAGTWVLTGANTFTGTMTIGNGSLSVATVGNANSSSNLGANGTINIGASTTTGTLVYTGVGETSDKVINLAGTTGGAGIQADNSSATLKFTSNFTATGAGSKTLTLSGNGNGEIAGSVVNNTGNTTSLTKSGTGTWTLSGNNTYGGATAVNGGLLVFSNTAAKATGAVTAGASGSIGLGVGATSGDFSEANVQTLFNTGNLLVNTSNITLNAASSLALDTTAGNFTQSSALTAARALIKLGANTLTLNGSNTYTGATTISAGTLQISSAGRLGGGSYSGNITNNGAFIYSGTNSQTLSGVISGTGALSQNNASSTLTLSGNNTFTGGITLSAGTLQVGDANALGTNGTITFSGGTMSFSSTGSGADYGTRIKNSASAMVFDTNGQSVTFGAIDNSNANGLTKNGSGTLTLSGANTYTGATTVNAGTLSVVGSVASSAIAVNNGGALSGNGTTGAITIASGGSINPGSGVGTINTGGVTLNAGGAYNWQLFDASGTAGSGWDLLSSTGALTLNGLTQSSNFTINLLTAQNQAGAAGPASVFNNTQSYTWRLAEFGSAISGFNADLFSLNATGFQNSSGTFSLNATGNFLNLVYTTTLTSLSYTAGTGNWSTAANWTPNGTPTSANALTINGNGGTSTNDLLSTVQSLAIASSAGSYTIAGSGNGSTITLNGGIANSSSNNQTISMGINLGDNQVFQSDGNLLLSGALGTSNRTLTVTGAGNVAITNTISGNGAIVKAGEGTLTLNGSNTYTGATTVTAGTLTLNGGLNNSSVTVSGGLLNQTATGTITGTGTTFSITSGNATLAGNNTYTGATTISAGTLTLFGGLNNSSVTVNGGVLNQAAAGSIAGTGTTFTLTSGNANLAGNNTYAGATTISAGTLEIASTGRLGGGNYAQNITNNGTFIYSGTANQTLSGVISGTGVLTQNNSASTLTLSGNNTYTGATTINGGTLEIASTGRLGGGSYAQNISNNGTFIYSGTANQTLSGVISGSGVLTQNNSASTLILSGNNTYTGATTINAGTLQIGAGSTTGSVAGNILNNGTLVFNRSNAITYSGNISGNGSLTLGGGSSSSLTLSGNNTYSGGTTIVNNGGTGISLGANNALGTGTLTLGNGSTLGRLHLRGYNQTITGLSMGTSTNVIESAGTTGGAIGTLTINLASGNTSTTTPSFFFRDGTGGKLALVKTGAGTLDFSVFNTAAGAMNYSGGLTVNDGTFTYSSQNSTAGLGNSTAGGIITLGGGTLSYNGTAGSSVTIANNMTLTASTASTLNNANGTVNVTGTISGSGNLIKTGAGTLALSAANTYSGNTTVANGTLTLSGSGTLGTSTISITGGTLDLGGSSITNTFSSITAGTLVNGTITNNNANYAFQGGNVNANLAGTNTSLTKTGSDTLTLNGTNSYTGATTISAGNISISSASALGSTSGVNLANNTTLIYTGGSASTLDRAISVTSGTGTIRNNGGELTLTGGLTKNGTTLTLDSGTFHVNTVGISGSAANSDLVIDGATVNLNVANTYNGPTRIIDGGTLNANIADALPTANGRTAISIDATGTGSSTLALGASQSIASLAGNTTSTVALGSSTLTIGTTSGSTTYAGSITGTGNLVKDGASTQVLTGNNTGFAGNTTISGGTLQAAAAGAMGNSTVINVNGGSFLVTAENAVNDNANINLGGGRMAVSGTFNENVGLLTLSANSTLDFAGFVGTLRFSGVSSWAPSANLAIWNWSGTTYWGTQVNNYQNPSRLVFDTSNAALTNNLANISFYSDNGNSFVGNGLVDSSFTGGGNLIIAVPEPETYLTGVLLILGATIYQLRLARQGQGFLARLRSHLQKTHRKPLGGSTSGLTQISSTEGISRQN